MDMRIVDVVIGLMLVFAILSLIATAAQEIIATMMNARGRHLERAIKSLLGGSPELFESVLKHPLIGSLSNTGSLSKTDRVPSYIPANLVVSALLHSLARSGRSSTPAQF